MYRYRKGIQTISRSNESWMQFMCQFCMETVKAIIGAESWQFELRCMVLWRVAPVTIQDIKTTQNVTLHPASNLRRHDGRRSFVWLLSVVAEVELATTVGWYKLVGDVGVVGDPVFLSVYSLVKASLLVPKCSRPAEFSSEYLLASFRSLSANDNELALSISSRDRFWMAALPFLSSSVMPNPYKHESLCIAESNCWSASLAMDNLVNVGLLPSAVLCLVGDIFIDNISKSVFLVAIDDGGDDITAGTFIVTDADDGVNDDDRLLGNTNVTDVTISSSSVAELLTAALVVVSLDVAVDVVVVAFPFCSYVYYFVISLKCN